MFTVDMLNLKSLMHTDVQKKLELRVRGWENKKMYLGVPCEKGAAK